MISAHELTELVLKFEELKEKHHLNYIIHTELTKDNGQEFIQNYNIQSLKQLGELLYTIQRCDEEVTITHITSHIGKKGE